MSLNTVRLDLNTPVLVQDAFVGISTLARYHGATLTAIYLDAVEYKDNHVDVTRVVEHVHTTDEGLFRTVRYGYHEITTELGDVVRLGLEWTYFSDSIYKRNREDKMSVQLVLLNENELKYPPTEIFVMAAAEFKNG